MTKTEQNRVLAWRLKVLREASAAPRNVAPRSIASRELVPADEQVGHLHDYQALVVPVKPIVCVKTFCVLPAIE